MYSFIFILLVSLNNLNLSCQSTNLGHLKPFGSVGSLINIDEINGKYPDVLKLFTYYLPKSEPILSRQVLINDNSYEIWKTDDELENEVDGLSKTNIYVDSFSQSQRTQMKFSEFFDRYQKEQLYLADNVPEILRKYITFPQPLQCEAVFPVLQSTILVMNGMNTSPLMINEEFDSLLCLFRGNKRLVLVNTNKYPDTRQIVIPENRQSAVLPLNPDKVDFNQFPQLANVEYHITNLTAGDCLLIPVHWIFHERSLDSTISIIHNIHHKQALNIDLNEIQTCTESNTYDASFTLDNINWANTENEPQNLKDVVINLVNSKANTYEKWLETFSKHLSFNLGSDPETSAMFDELYEIIDHDANGEITMSEIDLIDGPHQHHISDLLYEMFKLIDEKQKNKSSHKTNIKEETDEHLHLENYKTDL
ncbi:hypothetical protein I4U23_024953 [Adineta vaga]|nr:hypothetical protein I4U23_024953 [Adineta vaga]